MELGPLAFRRLREPRPQSKRRHGLLPRERAEEREKDQDGG